MSADSRYLSYAEGSLTAQFCHSSMLVFYQLALEIRLLFSTYLPLRFCFQNGHAEAMRGLLLQDLSKLVCTPISPSDPLIDHLTIYSLLEAESLLTPKLQILNIAAGTLTNCLYPSVHYHYPTQQTPIPSHSDRLRKDALGGERDGNTREFLQIP